MKSKVSYLGTFKKVLAEKSNLKLASSCQRELVFTYETVNQFRLFNTCCQMQQYADSHDKLSTEPIAAFGDVFRFGCVF